ncbi:MAG: peptidoglycan-binding protein [Rhizobiales bacterium]|nr:peptidoglycan-binding protein [Hyphomicrobiales bacterium]
MRKRRVRKEPVFAAPRRIETSAHRATPCHRRKDALVVLTIVLAAGAIVVNALFLQSGSHPAPIFVNKSQPPAARHVMTVPAVVMPRPRPIAREAARSESINPMPTPITASVTPPTPKADPVRVSREASKRVMTVQRVLAEFGYGQIKATGTVDDDTRVAIERYERQHKLPVTGEVSDRLTKNLSVMTGQTFD